MQVLERKMQSYLTEMEHLMTAVKFIFVSKFSLNRNLNCNFKHCFESIFHISTTSEQLILRNYIFYNISMAVLPIIHETKFSGRKNNTLYLDFQRLHAIFKIIVKWELQSDAYLADVFIKTNAQTDFEKIGKGVNFVKYLKGSPFE